MTFVRSTNSLLPMLSNRVVLPEITLADLVLELEAVTPPKRGRQVLGIPTAMIQWLVATGIGSGGFAEWLKPRAIPDYFAGTQLEKARRHLDANEHVLWLRGGWPLPAKTAKRGTFFGPGGSPSPGVALVWLRHIVDALGGVRDGQDPDVAEEPDGAKIACAALRALAFAVRNESVASYLAAADAASKALRGLHGVSGDPAHPYPFSPALFADLIDAGSSVMRQPEEIEAAADALETWRKARDARVAP